MSTAIDTVRAFCDLMAKRDPEALRPFLADGAVYQNTGMPASTGVDAVLENLSGQFAAFPDSYEYRLENIAAAGDVVLTERLDMIRGPDGKLHGVPVMGTFVLRDGKIVRWTDYFDTALVAKMMSGEDYRALVPHGR
ncbi:MAG TPA: limonene-1,2-epoxide hydrolase family protein [Acidimicrobiales bacterium]|nr:limonene-1,2-epoxide hydrolase family protein [Acidimicrobiales bacterium]